LLWGGGGGGGGGGGAGGASAGPADRSASGGEQPAMTDAAPMTALRIMNVRRSTPGGTSEGSGSGAGTDEASGSYFPGFTDHLSIATILAGVRGCSHYSRPHTIGPCLNIRARSGAFLEALNELRDAAQACRERALRLAGVPPECRRRWECRESRAPSARHGHGFLAPGAPQEIRR
jgi:hypothetical protein